MDGYISRAYIEPLVEELEDICINGDEYVLDVLSRIKNAPPATPQQKTGYWITKIKSDLRGDMWSTNPKCSKCGGEPYYSNTIYNYNFCPYCGAKMVESQESEE
jgi:DNA-directed RNA polymerase subunit RPC12/RpoP